MLKGKDANIENIDRIHKGKMWLNSLFLRMSEYRSKLFHEERETRP
jgi:hypothetical protein